jgi:hypothetical protein
VHRYRDKSCVGVFVRFHCSASETSQPALRIDFGQVIGDMLGDLMSSVSPIEVKFWKQSTKLKIAASSSYSRKNRSLMYLMELLYAGPSISIA